MYANLKCMLIMLLPFSSKNAFFSKAFDDILVLICWYTPCPTVWKLNLFYQSSAWIHHISFLNAPPSTILASTSGISLPVTPNMDPDVRARNPGRYDPFTAVPTVPEGEKKKKTGMSPFPIIVGAILAMFLGGLLIFFASSMPLLKWQKRRQRNPPDVSSVAGFS